MKKHLFVTPPHSQSNFAMHYMQTDYPEFHYHDFWEFVIVTEGTIVHKINRIERQVPKNTLLVLRPEDKHAIFNVFNGQSAHLNLIVRTETFKTICDCLAPDLYASLLEEPYIEYEIKQSITDSFVNMYHKSRIVENTGGNEYDNFVTMIFLSMLKELFYNAKIRKPNDEEQPRYSAAVNEIITLMHDEKNITQSIDEILTSVNYSHCHIIRLFKKEIGLTPSQYFLKIKLDYSKRLLESTNLTISNISSNIGFSSLGHFTQIFKREFGVSPATYRKKWNTFYKDFEETPLDTPIPVTDFKKTK